MENGAVDYSEPIDMLEGRYIVDTTATVTCSEGYSGGGVITCGNSGSWSSPDLPSCESESIIIIHVSRCVV